MQQYEHNLPRLISIKSACLALNVGRTNIYSLIKRRQLSTVKLGRRTLIKVASIEALIREGEMA